MLEYIHAGLIGYGYAGQTLHAPLLNSIAGIRLKSIVSRDGAKVKNDWPTVEHVATSDLLLADPSIDLVVIATPNDTHYPLAKAALLAGKHVVLDKPFTLDGREARELIALAQEHDLQLSVFHNRRWDADFLTLQQLIRSGSLGDILHLESHFDRFRPEVRDRWREQAVPGSGLWYDLGAHLLDQTVQLFGAPETLWLDMAQQRPGAKTDDFFHAVLQYGPRRVILHASTQVAAQGPRFTVHGSLGSYHKFGLDVQEEQLKAGRSPLDSGFGCDPRPGLLITPTSQGQRQQSIVNQTGDYRAFYQQMCDAIQRGTPVPVDPEGVVTVMELIELGLRSHREGRRLPVGHQHIDSVVQQAGRHQTSHSAPLAMPLSTRPTVSSKPVESSRTAQLPTSGMDSRPSQTIAPSGASASASRQAIPTPGTRPSPLPTASGPVSTRPLQRHITPAQDALARSTASAPSSARPNTGNFRSPTPLDRWQLQQEANRTAASLSVAPASPKLPAEPSRASVIGSERSTTPQQTPVTPPRQEPATSGPVGRHVFPLDVSDPHPAPSLGGPLPEIDGEDERKEPKFGTFRIPPSSRPLSSGQGSPGLFTDEPPSLSTRIADPLPRLRVEDPAADEDDDLPPFSAS